MAHSTACPDWRERIVAGQSLIPFDPLFPEEADAASAIFDDLVLRDVAGKPTFGQASKPWVREFSRAIFGAYDASTGERLIQNFFLCIAKKNSKSTLAAGLMLTALMRNWREAGEFYILAPTLEVANNSFIPVRNFVREDEGLAEMLHVQGHLKMITHRTTGAFLKVVAADSETVSGKKATGVFVDELWQFGKKAGAASMLIEATGGLVSRPEGFVVYATTYSDAPPEGVFKEKLEYFQGVRDGRICDPQSLAVIYEYPEHMIEQKLYLDQKWWFVTNPNIGASVSEKWIASKLAEYQNVGEHAVRDFIAKHLNVPIGQKLRADRWAGADYWESAAIPLTLEELLDRCEVVVIGCDGGGLDDLFGLTVIGRERETGHWLTWTKCWANTVAVDRRKSEEAKLRDFEKDGDLSINDRVGDDFDEAVEIIVRCHESGLLAGIGLDGAGITAFSDAIAIAIFGCAEFPDDQDLVLLIPQGYQLQMASKGVERKLADGSLYHADQAIMDWMVGNAKTEMRGNAVYITKAASGVGKIDGLMALFDAAYLMARNPQPRVADVATMIG